MIDEHQRLKDGILRVVQSRVGINNAITLQEIAEWLYAKGHHSEINRSAIMDKNGGFLRWQYEVREIRKLIKEMRREGKLICMKSGTGTFMPGTRQEGEDYIVNELEDRGKSILKTASKQRAALDRMFPPQEQLELFGEDHVEQATTTT